VLVLVGDNGDILVVPCPTAGVINTAGCSGAFPWLERLELLALRVEPESVEPLKTRSPSSLIGSQSCKEACSKTFCFPLMMKKTFKSHLRYRL